MYTPAPVPGSVKDVPRYLSQEFQRISAALRDSAVTVFYRTSVETDESLSTGDSANYKVGANSNIVRISTSVTVTLTGIADTTPLRERTFINVGTGVLVLKNQGAESSASHRFALPTDWNLSANATATCWYDPISSRHRGIART
jgi:hypothetical protein